MIQQQHKAAQQQQQQQQQLLLTMASGLLLLIFSALFISAETKVASYDHVAPGLGFTSVMLVEKVPFWNAAGMLLTPLKVTVNCSSSAYVVLLAASQEALVKDSATKVLWCGWHNILTDPNVCQFQLSTLRQTWFAVKPTQAGLLTLGQPELSCKVTHAAADFRSDLLWRFIAVCTAVMLFRHAATLAKSQAFRLTSGGVLGISGFAIVLLIMVVRNAPAKRAIGAGFAVSTTGMMALARWMYGTWAPGLQQVLFSRAGIWYVILTSTAGVALTYWLDDPNNEKINTSIRVGLQGLSLSVVYACIADEYVAIGAVLLLMTHRWLLAIFRGAGIVLGAASSHLYAFIKGKAGRGTDGDGGLAGLPDDWEEGSYHSSQDSDYQPTDEEDEEVVGGIVTEYDDDDGAGDGGGDGDYREDVQHAPALTLQQQQQPARAGAAGPGRQQQQQLQPAFVWRPAAQAAAAGGVQGAPAATAAGGEELGSDPSFDRWAQQQQQQEEPRGQGRAMAGVAAAGTAGVSSGGWGQPLLAVDRAQGTNQRQQQQQQQQRQPVGQRPSSTSPWSERKVLDITKPSPPPASAGAAAAAAAGGGGSSSRLGSAAAAADGSTVSPLVAHNMIINPETGRKISMAGPKYKELLERGFEPDLIAGTLVMSPSALQSPPAAAAAAAAMASNRGAPSPAGNLRSRKPSRKQ